MQTLLPVLVAALLLPAAGPRHVLAPGHEAALRDALTPRPGELPADLAPAGIAVPEDRVEAVFAAPGAAPRPSCAEAPLCVSLHHPTTARDGDRTTRWFALRARGARPPPTALVDGLAARLDAAFTTSPFETLGAAAPPPRADATVVSDGPPSAALEDRFRALLAGDPEVFDRVLGVHVEPTRVTYRLRTDAPPGELVVTLTDRPADRSSPHEVTPSFLVLARGGLPTPADLPARVHAAVAAADDGSLRLQPADAGETLTRTPLQTTLVVLSLIALLGLLLVAPAIARATARELRGEPFALAFVALGVVLRLALPGRLVEMGIGFQLTEMADALQIPRYGAAVPTLHHLVFQVAGADHAVLLWTHKVAGALALPVATAALLSFLRDVRDRLPGLATWVAGLLALTPMLLRSDLTESNLVPPLLAFWVGLLAWQRTTGLVRWLGTTAGLGWACLARPELAVVIPGAWLLLCAPWRDRRAALAVVAGLLAFVPAQLAYIAEVTAWEVAGESLKWGEDFWRYHLWDHLAQTALWEPRLVPLGVPVLGLLALVAAPAQRRTLWLMVLGGLAWVAVYVVDLSSASAPRLHVTGLLFWATAAAVGGAMIQARDRLFGVVAVVAVGASAVATIPWLWGPTNEDTEVALYDEASAHLAGAPEGYVLAILSASDEPGEVGHRTHRHVPRYRFEPRGRVVPLLELPRHLGGAAPVYYLQGPNCYAMLDRDERGGEGLVSPCRAVHERFTLEPVSVERVPNRGNPTFQELGYYGPERVHEIGLWRVIGGDDRPHPKRD